MRRCPLLTREVEGRQAMRERDNDAASRQHIGWIPRIARGGVQAVGVLDADVCCTQLGQIAEDAITLRHACIFDAVPRRRQVRRLGFAGSDPAKVSTRSDRVQKPGREVDHLGRQAPYSPRL